MEDLLSLRLLDPIADRDLFVTAYEFRQPKKHLSAPRIDFETFIDTNPTHLTIGLFNGELQVVYFFQEFQPRHFDAHFTSRKGVSRETVLEGGRQVLDLILSNGGEEVSALILPVNRPLRQFVAELGMARIGTMLFTSVDDLAEDSKPRVFLKYAATSRMRVP